MNGTINMIHIIIAAHGVLAESLYQSACLVVGEDHQDFVHTLCMTEGKDSLSFVNEAEKIIADNPDAQFLILADLMYASPCNFALSAFRHTDYRLLSGVNLPMLIEVIDNKDEMDLDKLWEYGYSCGHAAMQKIHMEE